MSEVVELSCGAVRYRDTGGDGPVVVFVHGLFMDGAVWQPTVELLPPGHRAVRPDLPLGAHTMAMRASADLSPQGVARILGEFVETLGLTEVTLVATDTGGAVAQLLVADGCDRVARVVLTPCDSFENFLPPSIRGLQYLARVPGALRLGAQVLRFRWARAVGFHFLSRTPLDPAMTARWSRPLVADPRIAADVARFLAAIDRRSTLAAAETLRDASIPFLLLWPRRLPYFPFAHAQRWARLLPDVRLVEVTDSHTLVCHDRPELLARELVRFVAPAGSTTTAGP